ncbi:hypothetical protein Tco_0327121 [Tanacetum coccineum]
MKPLDCESGDACNIANPVDTSSCEFVETGNANPVDTGNANPVETGNANPVDTVNANPVETGNANPVDPGNANPFETRNANPVESGNANPVETGNANPVETKRLRIRDYLLGMYCGIESLIIIRIDVSIQGWQRLPSGYVLWNRITNYYSRLAEKNVSMLRFGKERVKRR